MHGICLKMDLLHSLLMIIVENRRSRRMRDIRRGEIFYVKRGGAAAQGNEQYADRPAVVVSNDKNNENSGVVEIVYMTTQPKTDLPTHVTVRSTGRISTVLCEAVYSVSVDRVGAYIGECTDAEMKNINIALMISLQLDGNIKTSKKDAVIIAKQEDEIKGLREQLKSAKEDAAKWQDYQWKQEAAVKREQDKPTHVTNSEDLIRTQTERDTYKSLYEQLLSKLMNGGAA